MTDNTISLAKYVELLTALNDFFDREEMGEINIDTENTINRINVCFTNDFAKVNGVETCYDIQIDFNISECQYETYINDQLADVRKMDSIDDVIEELESIGFDDFVSDYFVYEDEIPLCVKSILEKEQ